MFNLFDLDKRDGSELLGKFLVANPYSALNEFFSESLIYLTSYSSQGAMGLVVNCAMKNMPLSVNLSHVFPGVKEIGDARIPVHLGGPLDNEKGFVLHTSEYRQNVLLQFTDKLAISSNNQIIRDISHGVGPKRSLLVMGYTGWSPGQLEDELKKNLWVVSDACEELIFDRNNDIKWEIALQNAGINKLFVSLQHGYG